MNLFDSSADLIDRVVGHTMKSRKVHAIPAELLGNMEALDAAMLLIRGHLVNANKEWACFNPMVLQANRQRIAVHVK